MTDQPNQIALVDLSADERPLDPLASVRSDHGCFGCGDRNPIGLHLKLSSTEAGVVADFIPLPEHQGFAGVVHGGIISTLLDEAMAWATAAAGAWAVTGEIRVRFRCELQVGEPVRVTARVTGARGRALTTEAEISRGQDGAIVASATATFFRVSADQEAAWRERYL